MAKKPKVAKQASARTPKLYIKQRHALIGFGVLVLVWLGLGTAVYTRYQDAQQLQLPKQVATVRLESLTWHDVQNDKAASPALQGYKYIGVTASVRNMAQSPVWFAPILQSYVKDTNGHQYGIEMVAFDNPMSGGQYEPNQQASGQLGFMVPTNNAKLQWCFESQQGNPNSAVCQPLVSDNKQE